MKIVLACGGSGGHIFPAVSVAEEIRRRHPESEIFYFCGKKGIEEAIFKALDEENIARLDKALLRGFFRARRILAGLRPQLVAGFGGYLSVPVVAAAKCLGLRTLVHEQNVFPGKANRWLCRIADGTALSFGETKSYLPALRDVRVTGNPIRRVVEKDRRGEATAFFGFSGNKKTLLVLGGSQGAESVNRLFGEALGHLGRDFKTRAQILHLCGKMPPGESEARCRQAGIACRAYSFFDRMDLAYSVADFALGRAGATFLAEIGTRQIPAILVPYPYGDGHQRENARVFSRTHAATVMDQAGLTGEKLAALLESDLTRSTGAPPPPAGKSSGAREALADFMEDLMAGRA